MTRGKLITEGKTKRIYETDDPDRAILEFIRPTAGLQISAKLFQVLESKGVATHFDKILSETEMLVARLGMLPFTVTVRNRAAGEFCRLFGVEEGTELATPVYELHFKSDSLKDPLVNEYQLLALKMATEEELKVMRERSLQVNHILRHFFEERDLELVDFRLEFGRSKGKILLGDEVSPQSCRLWENQTGKKLEQARLQSDLWDGGVADQDLLQRVLRS